MKFLSKKIQLKSCKASLLYMRHVYEKENDAIDLFHVPNISNLLTFVVEKEEN